MSRPTGYVHPDYRRSPGYRAAVAEELRLQPEAVSFPNSRICDAGGGAPAGATASERDDAPQMAHDGRARVASPSPTAGPAATSSQGDLSVALRELVADIADLEPVSGWSHARDLPPLEPDAVQLVLATHAVDVTDNCALDVALLAPLLLQSGHTADTAIAAHLRQAIELAARESLWPDIKSRLNDLNEQRYQRQQEQYHGASSPQTEDELREVNFAFDRIFR